MHVRSLFTLSAILFLLSAPLATSAFADSVTIVTFDDLKGLRRR